MHQLRPPGTRMLAAEELLMVMRPIGTPHSVGSMDVAGDPSGPDPSEQDHVHSRLVGHCVRNVSSLKTAVKDRKSMQVSAQRYTLMPGQS